MNTTLHPRFRRKPFRNKYEPKKERAYCFNSAKLEANGIINMWQRYGTDEYLLSVDEPTKEPVWVKVKSYRTFINK